jgi:hypothetical protein
MRFRKKSMLPVGKDKSFVQIVATFLPWSNLKRSPLIMRKDERIYVRGRCAVRGFRVGHGPGRLCRY